MLNYIITREQGFVDVVRANKLLYAASVKLVTGENIVVIMPELDAAPEYVYDFIIKHEEGHILYDCYDNEYIADKHAVSIVGKKCAIDALWWLFKDTKDKANLTGRLEILNRILNIKYGIKIFNEIRYR